MSANARACLVRLGDSGTAEFHACARDADGGIAVVATTGRTHLDALSEVTGSSWKAVSGSRIGP
eukprot:11684427-Heterocapsa_arctica.AAC.1